jgi:hypothetical protein
MSAAAMCVVEASTKRNANLGNGRQGAATAHIGGLMVTPLWPVNEGLVKLLALNSPREFKQCYHVPQAGAALPDVREDDVLTHGGTDYRVHHVAEWTDIHSGGVPCLHMVVQQIKGS